MQYLLFFLDKNTDVKKGITLKNKFFLLWGEAQVCLPYVCLGNQ